MSGAVTGHIREKINMKRFNEVQIRIARILLIAATSAFTVVGQSASAIDVTDHRPLAGALTALEVRMGISINYEDIPYESAADVEDVSTPQQRAQYPGYRLLVPRKGTVRASIDAFNGRTAADAITNVHALLQSYRANRLPGDFTVEQANGMLYVVPAKASDSAGRIREVSSPMTTLVTIPYAERQAIDAVAAVLNAVSKTIGVRMEVGSIPAPAMKVVITANQEPARDVLAKLFTKIVPAPTSYRLLFDPQDKAYMLNVQVATPAETGGGITAPVGTNTAPRPADNRWFTK
jgi:hypothetical protein